VNRRAKVVLYVSAAASALLLLPGFLLLVVIVAVVGGPLGGGGCGGDGGPGGGSQQIGPRNWSAEQTANAQLITSLVLGRRLPRRAAVIAISTAIVESGLRNVHGGDRDSLGLFQQRPSQGWGSEAQILNPSGATTSFLNHLVAVSGWQTMPPGVAAQAVQRSGRPGAYAPQESAAADLVGKFWTGPDNPLAGLTQLAATGLAGLTGCPDQGANNLPLPTGPAGQLNPKTMPPDYQLPADPKAHAALAYALAQLGKPYIWGATGPNSFDCSGLVQASWAAAGVAVSRSTATQVHDGTTVVGTNQAQPGDLLFTPGDGGSAAHPGHVGLYAGAGLVIDAYDSTHGVIVEKIATWAPKIVGIRKVNPTPAAPPPQSGSTPQILAAGAPG
jgi:hypothetical protein